MKNWESLIGANIEAHRDTHKVCKVEDARERNARNKEWRESHKEQKLENHRKWMAKHPVYYTKEAKLKRK